MNNPLARQHIITDEDCVMITGGCGAIGSEVVNEFRRWYPQTRLVNVDALTYAGKYENILDTDDDNYRFYYGNIKDASFMNHIMTIERPTILIHLAAETHVDNSFGNSLKFTETNVVGTHTLLECARSYGGLKLFLHMSTDEVYGSVSENGMSHEGSMLAPSNPYSASKAAAEMLCNAYIKSFNLPLIILRCNNAISKYQYPEKLVPYAIQCIHSGKKIRIHGEGKSKRTFIHAKDIARAIDVIITKGTVGSIYNIGSPYEFTVLEVVQKILSRLRPNSLLSDWITFCPDRPFQDYRYAIDSSALNKLGWSCNFDFDTALEDVIQHNSQ